MSRIFLSHSSRDNYEAVAIRDWLAREGWDDVFLDLDPDRGIAAGERWERALHKAALRCEAVIFLVSGNWLSSGWCLKEYTLARSLNKKLFAVLIEPGKGLADLPAELTGTWQVVDLAGGQDSRMECIQLPGSHEEKHVVLSNAGLRRLKRGLEKAGLDPKFFAWPPETDRDRAPFRGLKALDQVDAGIFFGRDAPTVEAMDRLRGLWAAAAPRLLVILGASGAGKSSFLRAGLLPRLQRDDSHFLTLPVIRPERAALTGENGLLHALAIALPDTTRAELRKAIQTGAAGIKPLLKKLQQSAVQHLLEGSEAGKPPAIVMAIDQAEELFRPEGTTEGEALLDIVRDLAADDDPAIIVVFAIRSDSYDTLEHAKPLEGVHQNTLPLLPMPRGAYKQVIEGPAYRFEDAGGKLAIEPQLTQRLLEDIEKGGGLDALPLLSFTLEQLFHEYRAVGALRLQDYQAFGGIKGMINNAVERVFLRADSDPRVPRERGARELLLRRGLIPWLAGVDPETRSPRRNIARRSDIPPEAAPLIDLLVEEHLLTTDVKIMRNDATGIETKTTTIEPAHEALLRQWGLLEGWLEQDFALLAALEGVKRATRDWNANGGSEAWLVHQGERLTEAQGLELRPDIAAKLDATDRTYLASCSALEAKERAEVEERRREREEEQARRLKHAVDMASANRRAARLAQLALAIFAALTGVAIYFWYYADAAERQAKANFSLAIDQAASNVDSIVDNYQAGRISTSLLTSLVGRAQVTVDQLHSDTSDAAAAKARLLRAVSRAYTVLSRMSLAEQKAEEELALTTAFLARDSSNPEWMQLDERAHEQLGQTLYWKGDLTKALQYLNAAMTTAQSLLAKDPKNRSYAQDLIEIYRFTGDCLRNQGNIDGAKLQYANWLELANRLADEEPTETLWLRDQLFANQRTGDVLIAKNKPAEARDPFLTYLRLATKGQEKEADNKEFAEAISIAHQRIGDTYFAQDQLDDAMKEYQKYLELAVRLATADQSNFLWNQDLEVAHQRIGEIHLRRGTFESALSAFRTYLEMAQDTLEKDKNNGAALFDVTNATEKMGDALRGKGAFAEALLQYRSMMTNALLLKEKDASNGIWKKALANSYQRIGLTLEAQGDKTGARANFQSCAAIEVPAVLWAPRDLWPLDVTGFCQQKTASPGPTP